MKTEHFYLDTLRNELTDCYPLTWSERTVITSKAKNKKRLPHLLQYEELLSIMKDKSMSRVFKRVTKNLIDGNVRQFLSFVMEGVGMCLYSFDNSQPTRFWFIPSQCLTQSPMVKSVNKMFTQMGNYPSLATMETRASQLKSIADTLQSKSNVIVKNGSPS